MIKLDYVIAITNGCIAIMNGVHQSILIDTYHLEDFALSDNLLKCDVKEMRAKDGIILVWLEGYGD